jgi:hypothetical protein
LNKKKLSNYRFRIEFILLWKLAAPLILIGGLILSACNEFGSGSQLQPSISINPQSGGSNTEIVVTGFNYPPETTISIRLGPPDVGATPHTYGSAVVEEDGRFNITFIIPNQWPDGRPILDEELMVIALNEDGSLKAIATYDFQSSLNIIPSGTLTKTQETDDSTLVINEQAIVEAVRTHLTQTGSSSQVAISVEQIAGEFARVSIIDLSPEALGTSVGFLKSVNSVWEIVVIGQNFDSGQLLELGLPSTILPEAILVPEG